MTNVLIVINVALLFLFALALFFMQKNRLSFSKRVFAGLGIGIVFGLSLQFVYGPDSEVVEKSVDWFNIVGNGYVTLLQMLVMPLVFISILAAFTKSQLSHNIGKIGGVIIGILIGTTAIAAVLGIGAAFVFDLQATEIHAGEEEAIRGEELEERMGELEGMTVPQRIVSLLPGNPFLDFTGARPTSTIAVVIFASFLGISYLGVKRKHAEQAEMFAKLTDALHAVVMRVVTLVIRLTPYGVLALMSRVSATSDLHAIWQLGKFVVASYVALLVMFAVHLLLIAVSGLNPLTYVKKVLPVLTFAFTSRSSAATLPLNVRAQHQDLGVPEGTANFAGSFGLTIGQNGCAGIYPAMLAVMIAPTVGINPLSPSFLLTLVAVVALGSFGVAGVGGGATFAALIVLSAMNLPVALAGLLISIEPLIDMGRTAVNVSGSMTAGVLTGRVTGELDTTIYATRRGMTLPVDETNAVG